MQKNFDYLGNTFQVQLLNQIIVDKEFSTTIMDVLELSYFDNKYFKIIVQMIKEYYQKYQATPTFDTLEQITKSEITSELNNVASEAKNFATTMNAINEKIKNPSLWEGSVRQYYHRRG